MKARSIALIACGIAIALALASCGVPVDPGPTALAKDGIPFHLLEPSTPAHVPTTTAPPTEVASVNVFLMGESGRLVSVQREVPTAQLSAASVLMVLAQGPTQDEVQTGLWTAIPPQTTVISASVDSAGVATINVGGTFGQLVGTSQIDAVAQIVFTATELSLPGWKVTSVTFELDGQPIEVPVASGAQEPVVNESDFVSIAPAVAHPGPAAS
jgi:Sporulation and spore germination